MKGAIRKNLLTERIDIVKPLGWYRDSPTLTDVDVKYLLLYFEENYGLTVEKKIIDAVAVIANENRYHPVCDFLNALHWDGTERIRFCLHRFLGSDTDDYTYEALKLFLLGAISRAFKPGCKFEVMLCLVGGQGAGKSSFFRLLAVNDDWFSDDLKKLDDENVYRKMQGHWIIEMSEMIATANAKSIEEIKSFLSRQKETYKIPYETHPADRKRQCVFGGSSNTLDFLPLDRTGNRRFVPVMVYPERAEVHILADEQASREYINQMWAEAMEIYRSGNFRLRFSPAMNAYLKVHQKDFMPEDTKAGQILDYLERYSGSIVCSKQLYKEALGHDYDEPKQWELREINDIMNNAVTGWRAFSNPRYFPEPYRRQKGWERIRNDNEPDNTLFDKEFHEIDGGQLDNPELSMLEARAEILAGFGLQMRELRVQVYEEVMEKAEAVEAVNASLLDLAKQIDQFSDEYDHYEYADRVDDKKSNIVEIYHDLTNGNAAPYRDFLEQVIEDSDEISVVQAATQLKNELDKAVSRPKESVIDQLKQISGQTVPSKMSHSFKEPER